MNDEIELERKLENLREEHGDLDTRIERVASEFEKMRLKKQKLALKDQIFKIEAVLYPDIIA